MKRPFVFLSNIPGMGCKENPLIHIQQLGLERRLLEEQQLLARPSKSGQVTKDRISSKTCEQNKIMYKSMHQVYIGYWHLVL